MAQTPSKGEPELGNGVRYAGGLLHEEIEKMLREIVEGNPLCHVIRILVEISKPHVLIQPIREACRRHFPKPNDSLFLGQLNTHVARDLHFGIIVSRLRCMRSGTEFFHPVNPENPVSFPSRNCRSRQRDQRRLDPSLVGRSRNRPPILRS